MRPMTSKAECNARFSRRKDSSNRHRVSCPRGENSVHRVGQTVVQNMRERMRARIHAQAQTPCYLLSSHEPESRGQPWEPNPWHGPTSIMLRCNHHPNTNASYRTMRTAAVTNEVKEGVRCWVLNPATYRAIAPPYPYDMLATESPPRSTPTSRDGCQCDISGGT